MAFFGSGYFGQGFTPADILFAQQNQQQPTAGSFQAPQQPTGSFFGSNPNLAQTGGLLSLLGTDGQQEKQGQSQQGGAPSTTSASASGSFFGGKREPSFEEQERGYSSIRDQVMKDPGSAALLAGLSILSANRPINGRTPGLGELVGAGGLGMIQGLGQMQQAQDVRRKQQMDMEMKRAELASKLGPKYEKVGNRLLRTKPDGTVDVAYEGEPELSGDAANLAIILGRNPTVQELMDYRKKGASSVNVNTGLPFDQATKAAGVLQAQQQLENVVSGLFDENGNFKRSTALASMIPGTDAAQYDKQATQALEAWLRAMTGAAITKEELDSYRDMYMPRPWDSEEVAKDKITRLNALLSSSLDMMGSKLPSSARKPDIQVEFPNAKPALNGNVSVRGAVGGKREKTPAVPELPAGFVLNN